MISGDKDLQASLTTSRTIAVVAAALGLFCACGLGPSPHYPPPPDLVSLSTNKLLFSAALGQQSAPQTFSIANQSSVPVSLDPQSKWLATGTRNPYALQTDCKASLPPGSSCTVTITFRPGPESSNRANLWINFQSHESHYVVLSGIVEPAQH